MMKDLKLSPRLLCAASFARQGSFIADVGTDHAYLPIYLEKHGIIRGAVASDINEGPAERARKNISSHSLESKICVNISNGLSGLEKYSPDDVFILGMGGELIADILGASSLPKAEGVRLILQPMTHPEILRSFLLENLYEICDEEIVEDENGKIYQIIVASYSGKRADALTPAELLLGKINISKKKPELLLLSERWIEVLRAREKGRALSKDSSPDDDSSLLGEIEKIREQLK